MRTIFPLLLITLFIATACNQPSKSEPDTPKTETPSASQKPVIYQMMTRLFGNKNSTNKTYGTRDENGVGKFADINETALKGIKELGVSHIWYTGVLEHATMTDYSAQGIPTDDADVVKGRAGSPYAIKDYYDVNPDLAVDVKNRMQEFEALIERTHSQGMKVLIDFVPNHVARGYKSDAKPTGTADLGEFDRPEEGFTVSNNFYYLPGESFVVPAEYDPLGPNEKAPNEDGKFSENPAKVTGNNVISSTPSVHDWFETVKLNYGDDIQGEKRVIVEPIPDTWLRMKDILLFWVNKGVDGFRCDMAEMVPVEFWAYVIPLIKENHPDVIFIAEIYNPEQYETYWVEGKFDYLYDKVGLYDLLRGVIQQNRSIEEFPDVLSTTSGIADNMLRFLENHDEQRIASPDFAGNANRANAAMTLSATLSNGPVLIYFGQEVGEPGKGAEGFQGEDGRTTIFDYWGVPEHQKWMNGGKFDGGQLSPEQHELRQFYASLLSRCNTEPALYEGDLYRLEAVDEGIVAYLRYSKTQRLLIIANMQDQEEPATKFVEIDPAGWTAMGLDMKANYLLKDLLYDGQYDNELGCKCGNVEIEVEGMKGYIFEITPTPL